MTLGDSASNEVDVVALDKTAQTFELRASFTHDGAGQFASGASSTSEVSDTGTSEIEVQGRYECCLLNAAGDTCTIGNCP